MKRAITALIVTAMLFAAMPVVSHAADAISIKIDGVELVPKDAAGNEVEPFVRNGTTYVPVRAIAEAFELSIKWDQATKTVFIGKPVDDSVLNDYINIYIDGEEFVAKDATGQRVYPILDSGTTYLPIRAVGEALGKNVYWDNYTKTAVLITPLTDREIAAFKEVVSDTVELLDREIVTVTTVTTDGESVDSEETYPMDIENLCAQFLTDSVLESECSFSDRTYYASITAGEMLSELPDAENASRVDIYITVENGIIYSESMYFEYGDNMSVAIESALSLLDYDEEDVAE